MRGHRNQAKIVGSEEEKTSTVAELSERAMRTMTATFVPSAKKPALIRVQGSCPNCAHPTKWNSPLRFWSTSSGIAMARRPDTQFLLEAAGLGKIILTPTETEFSMKCMCGKKARDHADGSCGALWNMRVAKPQ